MNGQTKLDSFIIRESPSRARANWSNRERQNWYYHGTQAKWLESILAEGLKPNCLLGHSNYPISNSDAVYLTTDKRTAILFAFEYGHLGHGERAFLIKIPKSKIPRERLVRDGNLCDDVSFEFHGIIEPDLFVVEETVENTIKPEIPTF